MAAVGVMPSPTSGLSSAFSPYTDSPNSPVPYKSTFPPQSNRYGFEYKLWLRCSELTVAIADRQDLRTRSLLHLAHIRKRGQTHRL